MHARTPLHSTARPKPSPAHASTCTHTNAHTQGGGCWHMVAAAAGGKSGRVAVAAAAALGAACVIGAGAAYLYGRRQQQLRGKARCVKIYLKYVGWGCGVLLGCLGGWWSVVFFFEKDVVRDLLCKCPSRVCDVPCTNTARENTCL